MRLDALVLALCLASRARVAGDRQHLAEVQMSCFKTALDGLSPFAFERRRGCWRSPSDHPLRVPQTGAVRTWRLQARWTHGHYHIYRHPGPRDTNSFDVYSLGPDWGRQSGGHAPDDLARRLLQKAAGSGIDPAPLPSSVASVPPWCKCLEKRLLGSVFR